MPRNRPTVLLTGASGYLGFETFTQLWEKRERYRIVLLVRPSRKNKQLFRPFEKQAGIDSIREPGTVEGEGLKIVWGDALVRTDLEEACKGIDWCLHIMALIPPGADRDPGMAEKTNAEVTENLVSILEAQDPDRIRMVFVGSVAQYGDRLPPRHTGRTGDPMLPSLFDYYALSKIRGELAVMESGIRHKVSLRHGFIMVPGLFSLIDPIMFHQPLKTCMENISVRDAGRILVNCPEVGDTGFWGGYYNVSGGPGCRTTFLEFVSRIYRMVGLDYRKVMERSWFALGNSHQLFFSDSSELDRYVHHWEGGHSQEDYYRILWNSFPIYLKLTAKLNRYLPPFRWLVRTITYRKLKKLARHPRGPLGWMREGNSSLIDAFYGSVESMRSIPGWDEMVQDATMPAAEVPGITRQEQQFADGRAPDLLDHGYDETKETLAMDDLKGAARFRGGKLISTAWNGVMSMKLEWTCCHGHNFTMSPHAVLKGGHWCLECISPPWNYGEIAERNPFVAQVRS